MDITQMGVNTGFGLPAQDYDKNGKLKPIRRRMVKKLLKYEFRAVLPVVCAILGVLAAMTILMCLTWSFGGDPFAENEDVTQILISILYAYAVIAAPVTAVVLAFGRYNKNFFKNEGYLTFSIPASMEEHIFAKHFSGIVSTLLALAGSAVSVLITFLCLSEGIVEDDMILETVELSPLSRAFGIIEGIILFAETLVGIFCVSGALECWGQKFEKKIKMVVCVVIAYVVFMVLQTVFATLAESGALAFFDTEVGGHVGSCLLILFYAAIIVFCVYYELKTLKRKLNLK